MDRKATAQETLRILQQGYYDENGHRVEIAEAHKTSIENSILIGPEEVLRHAQAENGTPQITIENISATDAILKLHAQGILCPGVLNFASAKNPGGGFLNGAMAQEESLAASSGLYDTQIAHPEYYESNRQCGTMMYTDYAIYSPGVVFFRDGAFRLLPEPVLASVLTLPAVNFGQVCLKGEDAQKAKTVMKARMRRALEIFASQGDKVLVLGAYGCGVFRNDPIDVARWWKELLAESYGGYFERIVFAILDRSKTQSCVHGFQSVMAADEAGGK